MTLRRLVLFASLAVVSGCGPHPFARGGYQHSQFPVYVAQVDGRIVSADWVVDGWSLDADERPVRRLGWGPVADLELRHRSNRGRMMLEVEAIDLTARDNDLRLIDASVTSGKLNDELRGGDIRLVSATDVAISGHPGRMLLLEAGTGPGAVRGVFVFIRANYAEERLRRWRVVPVLISAGYINSTEDFVGGLGDFQRFLQSLELSPSFSAEETSPGAAEPAETTSSNPGIPAPAEAAANVIP